MGKRKKTSNDLQNITQKTTDRVTGTPLKLQNITQKTTDRVTGTPLKLPNITQKTTDRVTGTPLKLQNITQKTTYLVTGTPLKPGVTRVIRKGRISCSCSTSGTRSCYSSHKPGDKS